VYLGDQPATYSYLLGLYLGDGHIAQFPRTLRLQIYLDSAYPGIIGECVRALRGVMPDHRVAGATSSPAIPATRSPTGPRT
jgi:hypothetical protein